MAGEQGKNRQDEFDRVVRFHGHSCPGLAIGYRVSCAALHEFKNRASDEELAAIVENDSCAIDAVQVMTGCTFGKGNLIYRDFGKQVYTFFKRATQDAVRISVKWQSPPETEEETAMWKRYMDGDSSEEVLKVVHSRKARKTQAILDADVDDLFDIQTIKLEQPEKARIYPSVTCSVCGEKVMEPRARIKDGTIVCIPCSQEH